MEFTKKKKRRRQRFMSKTPLIYCASICFFSVFAFITTTDTKTVSVDIRSSFGRKSDRFIQGIERERGGVVSSSSSLQLQRRYLSGPGSSPPRCTSKCGRCTPCKPVHVPVPPGTPVTTEYYPEAWRCKCGNRLYMP